MTPIASENFDMELTKLLVTINEIYASKSSNFIDLFKLSRLPTDVFKGQTLEGCDFSGSDLSGLDLTDASFNLCKFDSIEQAAEYLSLLYAAINGEIEVLEAILKTDIDVDMIDDIGRTALIHICLHANYTQKAQMLIDYGANVNHVSTHGFTPLMQAANAGHVKIAKLLIDAGADVNYVSKNGSTALKISQGGTGSSKLAQLLIESGAKE